VKSLTLAFSTHRPETLPYAIRAMRGFPAVALEEPRHPDFEAMLSGAIHVDDYLLDTEYEYPAFASGLCNELKALYGQGVSVYQVDPFMDELLAIHERFAGGQGPEDIEPDGTVREVYEAERSWTKALIDFYEISVSRDFHEVVAAVQTFARADAARGRLRDTMRAKALSALIQNHAGLYVESGYIHQYLPFVLKRMLPPGVTLARIWLMADVTRKLSGKNKAMGAGDILTVAYTFNPNFSGPSADLLAAKSLIHVKALEKEEQLPTTNDPAPDTRNEIEVSRLVAKLTFADCQKLYDLMRRAGTSKSRLLLEKFTGA
jgi:hypothetical protein